MCVFASFFECPPLNHPTPIRIFLDALLSNRYKKIESYFWCRLAFFYHDKKFLGVTINYFSSSACRGCHGPHQQ
jgi:hypothetical protein